MISHIDIGPQSAPIVPPRTTKEEKLAYSIVEQRLGKKYAGKLNIVETISDLNRNTL